MIEFTIFLNGQGNLPQIIVIKLFKPYLLLCKTDLAYHYRLMNMILDQPHIYHIISLKTLISQIASIE